MHVFVILIYNNLKEVKSYKWIFSFLFFHKKTKELIKIKQIKFSFFKKEEKKKKNRKKVCKSKINVELILSTSKKY